MKNSYLLKIAILSVFLVSSLFISGCGSSGGGSDSSINANVIVQLKMQGTGVDYPVDGMTVSIEKNGGKILTGVTNTDGIASIPVTKTGDYKVIKVEGMDATALEEGSQAGREFKKSNPLVDPYPNLTYTFEGSIPSVSVTESGIDYAVNATVPFINKVTVLKVGSVTSNDSGMAYVFAGTTSFAGRVMISNLNCNDNNAIVKIVSSDINTKLNLYINTFGTTPPITGGRLYVGEAYTTINPIGSYTQTGPVYFEAPGTDSGDWALGCNLSATELKTRGTTVQNFPQFPGGYLNSVLQIWTRDMGSSVHIYRFDYRFFQFEQY